MTFEKRTNKGRVVYERPKNSFGWRAVRRILASPRMREVKHMKHRDILDIIICLILIQSIILKRIIWEMNTVGRFVFLTFKARIIIKTTNTLLSNALEDPENVNEEAIFDSLETNIGQIDALV